MDPETFAIEEYRSLRREVEETKTRIFKILAFGIAIVPATHFLAQAYKLDVILYSTPILVVVVALMYLSENHARMRCGRYIRLEIEPKVSGIRGWESWLERPGAYDPRSVDKYLSYCFYMLYLVYFAGSVFMAVRQAIVQFHQLAAAGLLGLYISVGVWFLIFLIRSIRVSTQTALDREKSASADAAKAG